jgi:CubicO group peptidase (beta-lactamase class C family)
MWKSLRAVALLAIPSVFAVTLSSDAGAQIPADVDVGRFESILSSAYAPDGPGAAALVARGGEILYLGAAGMADLELGVPLAPGMVFEIGSITKQFTAAAIMMLAEEGTLSIADPITKHLPDYPAYGDSITVEHLLTHTSGIVSYTGIPGYMATKVMQDVTPADLIAVFRDLPVEFTPGARWAYNNSGYILLGAIIEAASGMPYADFVEQRIFEPLGMQHAYYGSSSRIIPRRASGYDGGGDGVVNQRYLSFSQPYAAGSLMMTVEDWHRWSRALFGGQVVSATSLERMTTPFVLTNGDTTQYGYGLGTGDVRGHRTIRHGGGIFGFATDGMYLPEEDVYVAVFANTTANDVGPGLVATRLAAAAVGDPYPQFAAMELPAEVLQRYVGVYRIEDSTERLVTVDDGALYTSRGGRKTQAHPSSETHFFYRTSNSHFEFELEDGAVTAMLMYQDAAKLPERAVRVSGTVPTREAVRLDRSILEGYVGVYEIQPGFDLTVYLEGDALMTRATGQGSVAIHASSETEFYVEEFEARLTFVMGPDGKAQGVVLHQNGRDTRATRKE